VLHVRRVKNGTPSTHPLLGDELRALRRLQRESPSSPFMFVSERGTPYTTGGFARMIERAATDAGLQLLTLRSILAAMAHRLSLQARRALELLDSLPHGGAEEFLILSGFEREMLAELVLAGLVTVVTEPAQTGTSAIKVERYHITDDGRKAIEG
jgi:hypothetical protein